mmetsp:Transcript_11760/g.17270  ORF Transcript_11760/g.17270 Transcript_11760/m.17270 type:complete len:82 (+) Transcript_11760:526-771(+)
MHVCTLIACLLFKLCVCENVGWVCVCWKFGWKKKTKREQGKHTQKGETKWSIYQNNIAEIIVFDTKMTHAVQIYIASLQIM